jgi:hypothetical protein
MLIRSLNECLRHELFLTISAGSCGIFNRLVTVDETWIHIYDPEIKQQHNERRRNGSPSPNYFKTQKSTSKVLSSVIWGKGGILLVDYLEKGAPIL